jgi:hypothetical protein
LEAPRTASLDCRSLGRALSAHAGSEKLAAGGGIKLYWSTKEQRLLTHFAVSLLVILAGSIGMLLLLHTWFGSGAMTPDHEDELDLAFGSGDPAAIRDTHDPFIRMPDHLKTTDEMVAWMTQELPKLTAGIQKPLG